MITISCRCAAPRSVAETHVGQAFVCKTCGITTRLTCAEHLRPGSGGDDFDATLTILFGPDRIGERFQLGGITDIQIGKSADRTLCLNAPAVSRAHARLVRVDFGPSRWRIVDQRSTNGIFVNERRIDEHTLQEGDVIYIGNYVLQFGRAHSHGVLQNHQPQVGPEFGAVPAFEVAFKIASA